MITRDKVTEIFCIADDFCKEFEAEIAKNALKAPDSKKHRQRKCQLSDSEIITILICCRERTAGEDWRAVPKGIEGTGNGEAPNHRHFVAPH